MSENRPPQRREVVSRDGNCFYRAVALWKDEIGNEKQAKILRSSDNLSRKTKVFELPLISSNSLKDLVRKSKITGTPAENMDIYIQSCIAL